MSVDAKSYGEEQSRVRGIGNADMGDFLSQSSIVSDDLYKVVREGIMVKMTFEQRSGGRGEGSCAHSRLRELQVQRP